VEEAMHVLKARVPIWKREVYADGSCSWKENCECVKHSKDDGHAHHRGYPEVAQSEHQV
jgi:hypothetical protein